jgi:hypothetical protein
VVGKATKAKGNECLGRLGGLVSHIKKLVQEGELSVTEVLKNNIIQYFADI